MNSQLEIIEQHFGQIAALIGEKSRAIMLWNLLDGRAYTATELAICANISKQAGSNHLLKLVEAGLLKVEKQGKHKYYRFANEKVAQVIENIAYLLPVQEASKPNLKPALTDIQYARTCYDHLAGKVGVAITGTLLRNGMLLDDTRHFLLTPVGEAWFHQLGIDITATQQMKRQFAYPCLDWSERKPHLGGALGAAFLNALLEKDWFRKTPHSRAMVLTAKGKSELSLQLKMEV